MNSQPSPINPISAPQQEQLKVEAAGILAAIIAADDGREPMDKARHNMLDPSPLEVLDFICAALDDYDQKIADLVTENRLLKNRLIMKGI